MTRHQHPIKVYRFDNDLTQQQFADLVGCSQVMVCAIESGRKWPSKKLALRIEKKTRGKVSATAVLFWEPRRHAA